MIGLAEHDDRRDSILDDPSGCQTTPAISTSMMSSPQPAQQTRG
jgi:hypothetical protein